MIELSPLCSCFSYVCQYAGSCDNLKRALGLHCTALTSATSAIVLGKGKPEYKFTAPTTNLINMNPVRGTNDLALL